MLDAEKEMIYVITCREIREARVAAGMSQRELAEWLSAVTDKIFTQRRISRAEDSRLHERISVDEQTFNALREILCG